VSDRDGRVPAQAGEDGDGKALSGQDCNPKWQPDPGRVSGGGGHEQAGKFRLDYALFHTSSLDEFLHVWWGLLISAGLGLAGGIGQLVIYWRRPAKADG
jgi:hypothetical protein